MFIALRTYTRNRADSFSINESFILIERCIPTIFLKSIFITYRNFIPTITYKIESTFFVFHLSLLHKVCDTHNSINVIAYISSNLLK